MKKLILISLVIFFVICSKSWADSSAFHSHLGSNTYNFLLMVAIGTPLLLVFLLNKINYVSKNWIAFIISILFSLFSFFLISSGHNTTVSIGIALFLVSNISIYVVFSSFYLDNKIIEIEKQKELKMKQLEEEEYKAAKENKAENGDHKAAIELSHNNKDNNIEAYYWNLVAEASGSREAISNKANILNEMSDLQINIAQERFKKWLKNKTGITLSNIYAPLKTEPGFGGCVYIMTCDKWTEDGLVKIGKSNNVQRRLNEAQKEVQGTYSPNPPTIKLYHDQFSRYYNELEKHIHLKLQDRRFKSDTSTATEFFRLTPEEAKAELDIAIREIEEKMAS